MYSYFRPRRYGVWNFLVDVVMTCLTCGFWLLWVYVREKRGQYR
jgi:uncharacterized membrane protein YjgN (DUF898 family)